jgi:GNAT superfamily N-acetyltransferase
MARRVVYQDIRDWDDLHRMVVNGHRQTGRWRGWTPDRIDGFIRGRLDDEAHGRWLAWRDDIGLWRASDGCLVAAIHPEGPDEAYLEVAPGWEELQSEMFGWAEGRWTQRHRGEADPPPLIAYADPDDSMRTGILRDRGYRDLGPREILRCRALRALPPQMPLDAYRVRSADLTDSRDRQGLTEITRVVFGVDFDDGAILLEERMRTDHVYLLAETHDGRWAAWCGVWSSPEIRAGQFEPVGTHPDHRRRGLASAVMTAGMGWMLERGLDRAFVGTGCGAESNGLYASLGFEPVEVLHHWSWRPRLDAAGTG